MREDRRKDRPDNEPSPHKGSAAGRRPDRRRERVRKPVETQHTIEMEEGPIAYTATTGLLPLRDEDGKIEAEIFFVAYSRSDVGDSARRPLMFSFNGGPGSSSVWLHLGALGPKRVQMQPDGGMPPPPFRLVSNAQTWLDKTDLVFIDPVGTGFSRARNSDQAKKFWGIKGDIESVGEFIRLYLTRYQRWASPLFLVGESYGTTRAAGLAGHLIEKGIAFNGIVLVSSILNFQTSQFLPNNDLPCVLFLPTYTATAWYHRRLAPDLQQDLRRTLDEVERWAETEYAPALARGAAIDAGTRQTVVEKLARYTGLRPEYIDQADLRIEIHRFCKELLRTERRTVGRLDSRFQGIDPSVAAERPDYDPSLTAIRPPYTALINDYLRRELGYRSAEEYYVLGGGIKSPWDWGTDRMGFPDTSADLRSAFVKNPYMKVFVASGYYDLATPYFATKYTLNHLGLDPALRANIVTSEYEAGHMMYIHADSLSRLKADVADFLDTAVVPAEIHG